jgi:OOP family OmpA-OmpF porin
VWLPSDAIELYAPGLDFRGYRPAAADLGVRAGYYPLRHFGLEGELAFIPSGLRAGGRALVLDARAQGVLQLGIGRIVPFAVLGGGVLAVRGDTTTVGSNADEALHVGGGIKIYATRDLVVRLDVRDTMSPKEGRNVVAPAHDVEVLLGVSWALGPKRRPAPVPPPADTDGDEILDPDDTCPDEAGVAPDGCPARDADDDGLADAVDVCPNEAGAAPDGCPIRDADDDGFLDPDDACPQEIGVAPDGCPIRDVDDDGILAPDDECPDEPETVNGFDDGDGCPDELPPEIRRFTGVIEGIVFDAGEATIRERSFPRLDDAAEVLTGFGELRVRISGHTDDRGERGHNLELSRARADAVKAYLVGKGIDPARIETRGAGPDEPVADNSTRAGRARNRRIEIEVLPR